MLHASGESFAVTLYLEPHQLITVQIMALFEFWLSPLT